MEFKKEDNENDIQWQKEQEQDKKRFDFAAFLGPDGLDDRVTDVMDGKDLLEPDAFDHLTSDYIPRRSNGEHGLHEAPTPPEEVQADIPAAPERPAMNPEDPRYAAPERPRVVVADPHPKKVYVSPVGDDYDSAPTSGGSGGKKGLIGAIVVLGIIAVVLLSMLSSLFSNSEDEDDAQATPKPTSLAAATEDATPTSTPADNSTSSTAQPTKRTYTITVTAGSGGSISPSGAVSVEEGGSVTFAIMPNSGYVISQLLVDGAAVTTQDSYTFTNVTAAHTIYAVFQAAPTATPAPTNTPAPTTAPTAEPTPDPTAPPTQDEPDEPVWEAEEDIDPIDE